MRVSIWFQELLKKDRIGPEAEKNRSRSSGEKMDDRERSGSYSKWAIWKNLEGFLIVTFQISHLSAPFFNPT